MTHPRERGGGRRVYLAGPPYAGSTMDLEEIDSCDAVLAAFTSSDEGIEMEAWYADSCGKPVIAYTVGAPPDPWTVYVADVVCDDLEQGVRALLA